MVLPRWAYAFVILVYIAVSLFGIRGSIYKALAAESKKRYLNAVGFAVLAVAFAGVLVMALQLMVSLALHPEWFIS